MSVQGVELCQTSLTEPDAHILQNRSKSQTYYQRHRETILRNRTKQYAEKQQTSSPIKKVKIRTESERETQVRQSWESYHRNRDAILKRRQEQRDSNKETTSLAGSSIGRIPSSRAAAMSTTSSCKETQKKSDKTSLAFWVQRGEVLTLRMQGLLDRALPPEVTLSHHILESLQGLSDPVVQYIEQLYLHFCFIFRCDEDYQEEESLIFQKRAEEMEALLTLIDKCGDAILNVAGYGKEYEHIKVLVAKALTISGWVSELEIEALDDPNGLIWAHHNKKLMYQQT